MGDFGFAIAKSGFNIRTAAVKDQVFNSGYNKFKIIAQGQTTVSVGATAGTDYTTTIAHGLSYTPGHMEFFQHTDSSKSYNPGGTNGATDGYGYGTTNGTNLVLHVTSNGTSYTATVYYYLFADPGA